MPLLISGTNKKETEQPQAQWIQLLLDAWDNSLSGGTSYGELWGVASDRDVTRRKALHCIVMCNDLETSNPLHALLDRMALMNMQCGKKAHNVDNDFKHKIKSKLLNSLSNNVANFPDRFCHIALWSGGHLDCRCSYYTSIVEIEVENVSQHGQGHP